MSGLAYYYIDDEEPDWTDYVYNACSAEMPAAVPLHFLANKEEVDEWKAGQDEVDPSSPLRDPRLIQWVSENLDGRARGWMMSEEDSKQDNLPVTHGMRLAANQPCEDYFALGTNPGAGLKPWNYWAVMDGHAGRDTAQHLQFDLIPSVSFSLRGLPIPSSSAEIEASIKQSFLHVDKALMDYARRAANWSPAANIAGLAALSPALSGSCALLAMFDSEKSKLRVACTGDSRAVLGRWDSATQSYTMIPLSVDQTGFNPKEVERLAAEHPDEPDIIDPSSGRLLGIAVTRAFGDHRWKWDNETIKAAQYKFFGSAPRPGNKTPPYMTAEPEITETDIVSIDPADPRASGRSDFMIMASDGLWDRISSEHAVECVQRWLEARARGNGSVKQDPQLLANPPDFTPPAGGLDAGVTVDPAKGEYVEWKATPEFFAIEDENAAVCLARNMLGGTRRHLFMGLLSVPAGPLARRMIDDTTIMVVFFDKFAETGKEVKVRKKQQESSWWPWSTSK